MAELTCIRCGKKKGFLSLNYAGETILGVKYPGDASVEYLCGKCQQALEPELRDNPLDGGIKKPRERTYTGLNLSRLVISQEVASYLEVNHFRNVKINEEENRTIVTGGDLAVIISGQPNLVTVAAGPRKVMGVGDSLLFGVVFSPLFVVGKGIGVVWDNRKVDKFFGHLDTMLYARAGMASPSGSVEINVPDKIRELAKLRDEGLISGEEFQTKRQKLLDKI